MTRRPKHLPAGLGIPVAALEQPMAIVGSVGSGKTYAAKGSVERLLHPALNPVPRRVLIIDPTGVWYGLRTMADGRPGLPVVIFGGEHADVPVSADAGDALGRLLAEDRAPQAIVDVSEMSGGERTRFLTALLERLYAGPRVPRHLILDEADEMAPQDPLPESRRLLGVVDRIVRRGRVRGFRPMMITQRPAAIHKNVLSQIATLVALRVAAPQDRKAVEAWVKGSADVEAAKPVLTSLSSLEVGEGWVWAPREGVLERVRFPKIVTADTSATPGHDTAPLVRGAMAPVDVTAIRDALAIPGQGEAQIPNNGARAARPGKNELEEADRRGYEAGRRDAAAWYGPRLQALADQARALERAIAAEIEQHQAVWRGDDAVPAPSGAEASAAPPSKRPVASAPKTEVSSAGTGLSAPRQRILDAIAWFESIGARAPEREIVAFLAEASPRSSGFANNLGALRSAGLVDYPGGGLVTLTDTGRAVAEVPPDRLTHAAIAAAVREKLLPAQWRLLEHCIRTYPKDRSRERLAEEADVSPSSSGYANNLGRLRTLGLITYPAGGRVRAADLLFPEARS